MASSSAKITIPTSNLLVGLFLLYLSLHSSSTTRDISGTRNSVLFVSHNNGQQVKEAHITRTGSETNQTSSLRWRHKQSPPIVVAEATITVVALVLPSSEVPCLCSAPIRRWLLR
ncbi:hypothetical protein Hdeb2414_s0009g00304131 [Helianthus debilis subsp. tardiflorus]